MQLKQLPILMMMLLSFSAFGEINEEYFEELSYDQQIDIVIEDNVSNSHEFTENVSEDFLNKEDEKHPFFFRCIARNWRGFNFFGRAD